MLGSLLTYQGIAPPFMEAEHRLVSLLALAGATVLDIGANVGSYTLQLSRCVGPGGRVIAFEPVPDSARRLRRILRLVRASNVTVVQSAVTNERARAVLTPPARLLGGYDSQRIHLVQEAQSDRISVDTTTVDYEVTRRNLPSVTFIKCDVEGAEWLVFEGAQRTLLRFQPVILCEVEDRWSLRLGASRDMVLERLECLADYRPFVFERNRVIPLSSQTMTHNNILLVPGLSGQKADDLPPEHPLLGAVAR